MVARVWRGFTTHENASAYEALLKPELLPGISAVDGYIGSFLLRRESKAEVEFVTFMLWASIDALKAIGGAEYESPVVPEDRQLLLSRYDAKVMHFDVASIHGLEGLTV